MLCDEYVQLLVDDSQMRSPVLDSMQGSLHEMEVAIRAYPSFPQGLEILEQLQGQLRDMRVFEKEYAVLSNRAPYLANSQLEQTMDELCVGNSFVEKNRRNIVDALQTIKRDSSARRAKFRRRKCIAAVWLLLVLIASAAGGYLWYLRLEAERRDLMEQEKDSQNRIERGWVYRMEKGYKIAEWKPGEYHSQTQDLKAAEKPDTWISTRPGYVWTEGVNIVWKPGIRHLQTKDLVAAKEKDKWISTKPGYVWISGTKISWKPGEYHPQTTDLKSGLEEGTWVSTKPGYVWAGGTDIVAWKPGEYHPKTNNLKAGQEEGTWVSTKPGYAWAGGMNIVWNPGVYHSQTTDLKAGQEEGTWVSTKPGYIWTGGVNIAWKKGLTSDEYPHWITVEEEGKWRLEDGYKYRNPDGQNVEEKGAIWNSSWVSADGRKRASSTEGRFEYQSKCDSCDGRGQKTVTENCPKCKGTQTVTSFKKCIYCDGSGSKKVMLDCDECRYGIVEETCYECVNGFVDCDQCGGAGAFAVMGPWGMVMTEPCKKCWGQRMLRHAKCNGTRKILKKCIFCGGKGKIQSREDCEKCDGDGRIEKEERCWTCDANGKVERIVDCRRCNGTGKVWK